MTSTAANNLTIVKSAQKEVDDFVKAGSVLLDAYNELKAAEKKGDQVKEMFLVNTNETTTMAYTNSLKTINLAQQKYDIAFASLSKEQQEAITAKGKIDLIFGDLNAQLTYGKQMCEDAAKAYDLAIKEAKMADLDVSKTAEYKKMMWSTVAVKAKDVADSDSYLARIKANALSSTITQAVLDAGLAVYSSDPTSKINDTTALIAEIERADDIYNEALKAKIAADAAYSEATKTTYKSVTNDNSAEIERLNAVIAQTKKDADAAVAKAKADADAAIAENKKKTDAAIAAAKTNNKPAPVPPPAPTPTVMDFILKTILDLIKPKA
jgi:hypothetical protein